jgi:hypothetical protein
VSRHSSNENGLSGLRCTVKTVGAAVTFHGTFRLDKGTLDQTDSIRNRTFNAGSVHVKLFQIVQGAIGIWHKSIQLSVGDIQYLQIFQQTNFRGQGSGKEIFVYVQDGQTRQASNRSGDGTRKSKDHIVRGNVGIDMQLRQVGKDAHVFGELAEKEIYGKVQVHQLNKVGESNGQHTSKNIRREVQVFQVYQLVK